MMQRSMQKSVEMMMDLTAKFSNVRDLVLDPCDGTFATAKICLLLLENDWFADIKRTLLGFSMRYHRLRNYMQS